MAGMKLEKSASATIFVPSLAHNVIDQGLVLCEAWGCF